MAVLDRSFSGNVAKFLAAQMKWEVLEHHFWGKFAKFNAPKARVIVNEKSIPNPISSPIVMQHELKRMQGDLLKIPLLRNLLNLPTVGMDQLKGHEELQQINHAQVPIDIVRHAVMPQEGIMSKQTTKDYELIMNAKPQLLRHYAENEEFMGATYAFYYGYSYNVLESSRFSGNSLNVTANSHPHTYIAGQGKASYTAGYPGSAAYEDTIGTMINAMVDTNVFDTQFLSGLAADKQIMRIDPIIMYDGSRMRFIVAHPYQLAQLEADEKFRQVVASTHAQAFAKNNPLLVGCKYIWAGFAIFESNTAVWPVSVSSGDPVWGPSTISNMDSFMDYESGTKFAAILLGNNALFKATGQPFEFKKRVDDYEEIIGIAYRVVEGYSRGDYWNEDDVTRGQYLKSDGSAVLVTYTEVPSM